MPLTRRAFIAGSSLGAALALTGVPGLAVAAPAPPGVRRSGPVGYVNHDLNPRSSSLTEWGVHTAYAADYDYRSIGIDLGASVSTNALVMDSSRGAHGLNARDWSVYRSTDNRTWTKMQVEIVDRGTDVWFLFPSVTTRYLKVHNHREFTDAARFSFVLSDMQTGLRAYALSSTGLLADGGGSWSTFTPIVVTNPASATLRDRCVYITHAQLGTAALVSAGKARADLADLRFTDAAGSYLHAYADGSGTFVRIPSVASGASLTIRCYSGNPSAEDVVHHDGGALQVEYGQRTLTRLSHESDTNPWGNDQRCMALPSGVVVTTAGWTKAGTGGIGARYSRDNGRTFGPVVSFVPGTKPEYRYSTGSYYVDPGNGALHFAFYRLGAYASGDWMDPATHDCTCWIGYAGSYAADGSPIFTKSVQLRPFSKASQRYASWALTYTTPVRTPTGAILVPVSYAYRSDGGFAVTIFRSTDRGSTWKQMDVELTLPGGGFEIGVSECALLVETNGAIRIYARAQGPGRHRMVWSRSTDDGVTWGPVSDSPIIASNTMPSMTRGRGGEALLSWSGHNTMGQTSYWRNNLTMAYSDDDGVSWGGYHDLTGATSLSLPGVGGGGKQVRVLEADSTAIGATDRLVSWSALPGHLTLPDNGPRLMLIEDDQKYLRDSHGAMDMLRFRDGNTALVSQRSELAHARWWRLGSDSGALAVVDGPRAGAGAVQLTAPAGATVGGSRLFPGIRRGRIRFRLHWTGTGSGIDLAFQEAYGGTTERPGTVAALRITPNGTVRAFTRARGEATVGYCNGDTNPATGNLSGFGEEGLIALDYARRSVGARFSTPAELNSVTLVDNDHTTAGRPGTRVTAADLSIWVSDTNNGDWRRLTDWTASGTGGRLVLSGPPVVTKYVKVAQPYSDASFTFVNDFRAFFEFTRAQNPLPVATVVPSSTWTVVDLAIDLPAGTVGVTIGGTKRATLPVFAPAQVVTHLLAVGWSGGGAVSFAIDELLVQDTSAGLPVLTSVGAPQAV